MFNQASRRSRELYQEHGAHQAAIYEKNQQLADLQRHRDRLSVVANDTDPENTMIADPAEYHLNTRLNPNGLEAEIGELEVIDAQNTASAKDLLAEHPEIVDEAARAAVKAGVSIRRS